MTAAASMCCLLLASCSSGARAGAGGSSTVTSVIPAAGDVSGPVRAGGLVIADGYIPQPASPDVAAAYLHITNDGSRADRLVAVTSGVAAHVMPMTESVHGTAGSMTKLPNVAIAPHHTFAFRPGHAHLMIEHPTRKLRQGEHVRLVLHFVHAGRVPLTVPVVPITGPR